MLHILALFTGATAATSSTFSLPLPPAIPIKADEIQEGGGFDEDEKINPTSYQGSRYYKSYIVPISGQDGDKLAEKPVMKEAMKLKTKADRAMDMLNSMQGAGV